MMRRANAEQRTILTRRMDMLERQFSGSLFLVSELSVGGQLNQVISQFSLKINQKNMFRICLSCNEELYPVVREEVQDLLPPYVYQNYIKYNKCPCCGSIYWAGTHQRNALQFLERNKIKWDSVI
jgi:uncharacterized protein with PIN domain